MKRHLSSRQKLGSQQRRLPAIRRPLLNRIQDILITRSLIQRLLGPSTLIVQNPGWNARYHPGPRRRLGLHDAHRAVEEPSMAEIGNSLSLPRANAFHAAKQSHQIRNLNVFERMHGTR